MKQTSQLPDCLGIAWLMKQCRQHQLILRTVHLHPPLPYITARTRVTVAASKKTSMVSPLNCIAKETSDYDVGKTLLKTED